jgi:hypothetical protein
MKSLKLLTDYLSEHPPTASKQDENCWVDSSSNCEVLILLGRITFLVLTLCLLTVHTFRTSF